MTKNERKLREALHELKSNGAKINPSAVEKKAGVSNGSLKYYEKLHLEVVQLKRSNVSDRDSRLKSTVKSKNKAMKLKRDAETELNELKSQIKLERQEYVDSIANLTWALHKSQQRNALDNMNRAYGITKIDKS